METARRTLLVLRCVLLGVGIVSAGMTVVVMFLYLAGTDPLSTSPGPGSDPLAAQMSPAIYFGMLFGTAFGLGQALRRLPQVTPQSHYPRDLALMCCVVGAYIVLAFWAYYVEPGGIVAIDHRDAESTALNQWVFAPLWLTLSGLLLFGLVRRNRFALGLLLFFLTCCLAFFAASLSAKLLSAPVSDPWPLLPWAVLAIYMTARYECWNRPAGSAIRADGTAIA